MLTVRLGMVTIFLMGLMTRGADGASGQDYPYKPIRIVTGSIGGGADFVARLIAHGISGSLGQQMIVDNRGVGAAPGEVVSKSPPDGYTLLIFGGIFWMQQFFQKNMPYDPVKDFLPITLTTRAPDILLVHPVLPVKSVGELIALAKAKPGALNYASGGTGSANLIATELFKAMAGVDMVHIPYKGVGPALIDLMGGQVELMFATMASATPHIKSGRLRPLAVASERRSALFPDLPTVAATLPGYESGTITGAFTPAKTPALVIQRLNEEIVRFLKTADARARILGIGAEAVGSSPEELAATVRSEIARLGKVIKDAGIGNP